MTLLQILGIVRARGVSFLLVLTAFVVLIGGYTLLQPKTYTAVTSLVIDAQGADSVTGTNLPAQLIAGYMATQADIITSRKVAQRVIDQLGLLDDPALRDQFTRQAGSRACCCAAVFRSAIRAVPLIRTRGARVHQALV